MLSEKIEIVFDGHIEYGASEEEMRSMFGAPTDITPWVWLVHEEKEIRIDERMPRWEKTVFDGKKLKITFNAWPNVLIEEDGSLTKFYWVDFDARFKRKFDFNIDSMISDIKNMAESLLETNEGAQELAERMVEYRNILHHYIEENRENCLKVIGEFFEDDEKHSDQDMTRWDIFLYEGDNLELMAEVTSCDGCEWPNVDIWFNVRTRDVRAKEVQIQFKKLDKEKYRAMTIDELNSLIEKNLERLVKKAEQADKSSSGNIMRDMTETRAEIRMINQVLDEKYYWGIEKEKMQEILKTRLGILEDMFSKYADIYMYPLKQVNFEKRILEIFEERKDNWCRELKQDECGRDDVCWEGECINAIGGDETCDNEVDDDGDHAIDCDDPDCSLECGRACDHVCGGSCGDCQQEQCGDICEDECWPCYEENKDNQDKDSNPCESACTGCHECSDTQCNTQPVCAKCNECRQETYECFDVCNKCNDCESTGRPDCGEGCDKCDECKATDTQRECLDFCDTLGDEKIDEFVRDCKDLCRQDVIFICPTGKQYTPCENVHYVCDGVFVRSVPCVIYECEDGTKQTAPCGQEVMCGENQLAEVDKCVCEEGFYDCDDNDADCEATKECGELIENCKDRIDNDGDELTDCEDLFDCKTGRFCGQGPADEPMYCYEGSCSSTTCGDGICDADETLFSCPPDCKLTKPVCGDEICSGDETEESCPEDCMMCPEGQILNEKGICVDPIICPIGYINMNDTCVPPPEECVKEGEVFDKMGRPDALCCEGLIKRGVAWPDEQIGRDDVCIATETWEQTCTNCGDGECGLGENWCICPEDCSTPGEVPCEADADCGVGFCSQVGDTCLGTSYTCLEGNCSGASVEHENFYCIDSACTDSCGDGVCEPPEINRYCPEDCLIINVTCEEGQEANEEGICVNICGNGIIDEGEDCESCPLDAICLIGYVCEDKECVSGINITCPPGQVLNEEGICVEECIKEGEYTMDTEDCCPELRAIRTQVGDGRVCSKTAGYVCTGFCGDEECAGIENPCNCEEDCPIPGEVNDTCTSNADCGTDTCHQGGSTCKEIQFVCEEGDCSAVSTDYDGYSCARYYSPELPSPDNTKCLDSCGDGVCKRPENKGWCPEDCKKEELCGNGIIDPEENCKGCPSDVVCQEGYSCTGRECIPMLGVCPEGMEANEVDQCVNICGNGRINEGEDCDSCPKDVICSTDFVCENKECVPEEITCLDGYVLNNEGECELIIECKKNQIMTDQ
ncbi:hypothetical protein CMO89_02295 [Candidatus Woesearchaeota archaeon]|nr:hypothetical protein [Candidatus Woesearchaeota archaeon]|tara:strand:- start:1293 stop:5057 length:3765 start_codon:yes stop_codon:yes gene_type:complete